MGGGPLKTWRAASLAAASSIGAAGSRQGVHGVAKRSGWVIDRRWGNSQERDMVEDPGTGSLIYTIPKSSRIELSRYWEN